MANVPTPIRIALGLAATAVDEARKLPERMPELPMTAISTAMQASMRVQQRLAELTVRGDEVLSRLRGSSEEPPSWATFDDDATADNGRSTKAAFELVDDAVDLTDTDAITEPAAASEGDVGEPASAASAGSTAADSTAADSTGLPAEPASTAGAAPAKRASARKSSAPAAAADPVPAKKAAKKATKRAEPIEQAARRADEANGPTPSTVAAEIVQAHQHESD